jgi:enoyl-[acyl-carrier protein] reductase I
MARGVSGEVLHVDAGYHVVGMMNPPPRRNGRSFMLLPQQK